MLQVISSAVIDASPEVIYAVFSDYEVAHKAILPKPYFSEMVVLAGGQGAGTVIDVHMDVFGNKKTYHLAVTEPEPGRLLVETDYLTGERTHFIMEPLPNGRQTKVTIDSKFNVSPGFAGKIERFITPLVTGYFFKKELGNLAAYLKEQENGVVLAQ
jgi:hypothetical protein